MGISRPRNKGSKCLWNKGIALGLLWDYFGSIAECLCCLTPMPRNGLPQILMSLLAYLDIALTKVIEGHFVELVAKEYNACQSVNGLCDWDTFFEKSKKTIDFEPLIVNTCKECNISTTNKKDIRYVGFMICACLNVDFPTIWGLLVLMAAREESLIKEMEWLTEV